MMVEMKAKAEHAGEVSKVLVDLGRESKAEGGCELYEFVVSAKDATRFRLFERWSDKGSFDAHATSPHLQRSLKVLGPLLVEPLQMSRWDIVA